MHKDVRPALVEDIPHIEANLKEDDRRELKALYGRDHRGLVLPAFQLASKVLAWGPEGAPHAIFGVCPDPVNPVGYLWALSTPDILTHWREVHRSTPAVLDELGRDFRLLANIKDARHRHHIRWLRSLGFTFISTVRLGPEGLPFHEFVRIQK